MDQVRSLELYGTIAFARETMMRMIGFGQPFYTPEGIFLGFVKKGHEGHLNFEPWLRFVPRVYQSVVENVIEQLFPMWLQKGLRANEDSIERIADDFLAVWESLFDRIENGALNNADASGTTDEEGTTT